MKKLNNIIVGFTDVNGALKIKKDLLAVDFPIHLCRFLDREEAERQINPDSDLSGFLDKIKRSVQKNIGGGPSEFIRDVNEMNDDDMLFIADVDEIDDTKIEKLKDVVDKNGLRQAKHFGSFSVEHLVIEEGHRSEIPVTE